MIETIEDQMAEVVKEARDVKMMIVGGILYTASLVICAYIMCLHECIGRLLQCCMSHTKMYQRISTKR